MVECAAAAREACGSPNRPAVRAALDVIEAYILQGEVAASAGGIDGTAVVGALNTGLSDEGDALQLGLANVW